MAELCVEKIRLFRLYAHHLDRRVRKDQALGAVGACGMQNTPPGAWETALFNRVDGCGLEEMRQLLYTEKSLLQAWSFRGAPVVFPVADSSAFLSALVPEEGGEWIYTHGIFGALDYLQMTFDDLLDKLKQVMLGLDEMTVTGKSALDQTLAEWMLPLIPAEKKNLWNAPSMYGRPDIQTVGGAVVSFLLRPCSFLGLVVFGRRHGVSPTFTSYAGWTGTALGPDQEAGRELVRKYLHCYGPATLDGFMDWLGCTKKQARRLWNMAADEMEPVGAINSITAVRPTTSSEKAAFILSKDKDLLFSPPLPKREVLLLGGHDPYLDQRDRHILVEDKKQQKQVWQTVTNPGVILWHGKVIGVWSARKKGKGMEVRMSLWEEPQNIERKLYELAEEYAVFRQLKLLTVEI